MGEAPEGGTGSPLSWRRFGPMVSLRLVDVRTHIKSIVKKTAIGRWAVGEVNLARSYVKTKRARLYRRLSGDRGIVHPGRRQQPGRLFKLSADGHPTYFGYYDKSPFDAHDRRILAMSLLARRDDRAAANHLPVRLGYFEWAEALAGRPRFHSFGESSTWSWQQGCMLQWYGTGAEETVIYNRLVDGLYGSVVQDVATKKVLREIPFPLYAIEPYGRHGVSLNFSRLERLRPGYGYAALPDATAGAAAPDDDGIWLHDLATADSRLAVSLQALSQFHPDPSMTGAVHYVNHLQLSPDGTKLIFLHLWMPKGPRRNRLLLYDLEQRSLHVVDDAATVSHFNWLSGSRLILTRFPFQGEPGYFVCDIDARGTPRLERLSDIALNVDGHPSLSPAGNELVTDSYPDRFRDQGLYLYSLAEKKTTKLGAFYSPCRFRGFLRCDLHPRWNRTGTQICFDSTLDGRRAMYIVDNVRGE